LEWDSPVLIAPSQIKSQQNMTCRYGCQAKLNASLSPSTAARRAADIVVIAKPIAVERLTDRLFFANVHRSPQRAPDTKSFDL
jgi:hypothetical protein